MLADGMVASAKHLRAAHQQATAVAGVAAETDGPTAEAGEAEAESASSTASPPEPVQLPSAVPASVRAASDREGAGPEAPEEASAAASLPRLPEDAPRVLREAEAQGWLRVVLVGRKRAQVVEGAGDWRDLWQTVTKDEQTKALVVLDKRQRAMQRREHCDGSG